MRTKLKVLSALVGLVSIGASVVQAQVYSQNVVGYVNTVFPAGQFVMFSNPLDTTNTIGSLFSNLTDADGGTYLYKWSPTEHKYLTAYYLGPSNGGWMDNDTGNDANSWTMNPGEGAFFQSLNTVTTTFVGNVMQGSLTNTLAAGFAMVGSMVPQSSTLTNLALTTALGDGDYVYRYTPSGYATYLWSASEGFFYDDAGNPSMPSINVGEAVFVSCQAGGKWIRTFNVQ